MSSSSKGRAALALLLALANLPLLQAEAPSESVAPAAETEDKPAEKAAPAKSQAEEAFWKALRLLESKDPAKREEGKTLLLKASNDEFPAAQAMLANCYLSGTPVFKKDAKKAAGLFRLAAERGNGYAMVTFAQCLILGTGTRKDQEAAITWLRKAVSSETHFVRPLPPADYFEGKNEAPSVTGEMQFDQARRTMATASLLLGQLLREKGDYNESHTLFVKAAEAEGTMDGLYVAAVQSALDFAFAQGTARDMDKANAMIELSKKLTTRAGIQMIHDSVAMKIVDDFAMDDLETETKSAIDKASEALQLEIANSFLTKKEKTYNPAEAERWLILSAENGNVSAQLTLGENYITGTFGKPDYASAYKWYKKVGSKFYIAQANCAIALQNGVGVEKDTKAAAELFEKYKNEDLVCYLGSIGQCPPSMLTYSEVAKLNEVWAKEKEDPQAQYFLGLRYLNGWGVEWDKDKAKKWYTRAANKGNRNACRNLGKYLFDTASRSEKGQADKGLAFLRKAMDLGDAKAAADLGYAYTQEHLPCYNAEEGRKCYERALQLDPQQGMALNNLGYYFNNKANEANSSGDTKHFAEYFGNAVSFWKKAGDESYANFNLGQTYYSNGYKVPSELIEKDDPKAYSHFQTAADGGHLGARRTLGYMHLNGEGVPATPTEAAYHFRIAALEGDMESLRQLCDMYMSGNGVSQDFDRAIFWINRLFNSGQYSAILVACDAYLKKGEYKTAISILNLLEDSSNEVIKGFACHRLYVCNKHGLGMKVNEARAERFLKKSIDLGFGDAIYARAEQLILQKKYAEAIPLLEKASKTSVRAAVAFADLYLQGLGTPENPKAALALYRSAANNGDAAALYALAYTTYKKIEGAPSIDEALRLLEQAKNQNHPQADKLIKVLEKRRDKQ